MERLTDESRTPKDLIAGIGGFTVGGEVVTDRDTAGAELLRELGALRGLPLADEPDAAAGKVSAFQSAA